ncbi:MAG TPA: hypothetical protein PLQ13_08520 [Candidatus Krumholzibacteria bacterium]|nr:hypothetical protein [Candidatus Krumholzibacteria bacterium]
MKSVAIISVITFILIFGGVLLVSMQLNQASGAAALPDLAPADYEAAERVFQDMAAERDRIQREKEELLQTRQSVAVQEKVLEQSRQRLESVIAELEQKQAVFAQEREASAARLAKMYEAMKPEQAAPIIAALEMDVILDIMSRMKERPAAKILAKMDAGLAAQISTRLSAQGGLQ